MKLLSRYFLRGTIFFLPFGLTIYVLLMLVIWSETIASAGLKAVIPEMYFPGFGLILAISFLILLGFFVSQPTFGQIFAFVELPFKNVPLVKSIYTAVRSFADYFSPDAGHSAQQVVIVKHPDWDIEFVGFVTRKDFSDLPKEFPRNKVAVYVPLSYQIGGNTVMIPPDWLRPVDMKVEDAMRSILTGWMPAQQLRKARKP